MKRPAPPRSFKKRKQQRHDRLKRTLFYNLRQGKKRTTTPRIANTRLGEKAPPNALWENIVLHYLNKLKSSWKSKPPSAKDICTAYRRTSGRSSASNSLFTLGSNSYKMAKKKALNIVKNAVEYGQAKGIISKNGRFFWFENKAKKLPKKSLPVLMTFCEDCAECRKLMKLQTRSTKRFSSLLPSSSYSTKSTVKSRKEYYATKDKHPKPLKKQVKRRIVRPVRYQFRYNKRNRYGL